MPATLVYRVEKAKSSRSKCKGVCKQSIPKDALRFGSAGDALHGTFFWRCMKCITNQQIQGAEKVYGSIDKIPGIDDLPDDDRRTTIDRLHACKRNVESVGKDNSYDRSTANDAAKTEDESAVLPEKSKGRLASGKRKKADVDRGETSSSGSADGHRLEKDRESDTQEEVEGSGSEELPSKKAVVHS